MARSLSHHAMRRALYRSNTKVLMTGVMIFQALGMLLLALKTSPLDTQALGMAILMPLVTWLSLALYGRLFRIDRALMLLFLFLCSIGLVTLQDIARSPETPFLQALYTLLGLGAMGMGILLMRVLRRWDRYLVPLMLLSLAFLALPLAMGSWKYGAKNWIEVGGVSIQPSEFGKPALILCLAAGLSGRPRLTKCLPVLGYAALLCGLLLLARDLGALLLYFLTTCALFYAATSHGLLTLAGLGAGAGCAVGAYHLFPYVARRVESFQNPWSDPLDSGYQIIQALIAIGSGGLLGLGLGRGFPRNIPLYHSDFIFAAICEEFGVLFALGLLGIYLVILVRGAGIALAARSSFHALTALGVVILIACQTLVIVGGNTRMIPLTGVTLPFISAGGSSVISMMGCAGLLLGVSSINAHDEWEDYRRRVEEDEP
ncbi:MAG: FtsW/RodA/SpoVE family cell cycle protein [Candidatus Excrementavichristensenella sp.]|jgi:cell division protein FtsW (lipid II flippase)